MRRVGSSDLEIFPLGLGASTLGSRTDESASRQILDAFLAAGGNFVDSADSYSYWVEGNRGGESETILGDWMRARSNRQSVVVATKVGAYPEQPGLAPDNVVAAADASLRRLRTDYIDLYYAHKDDPDVPIPEIAGGFDRLVTAGKVRYVGISNFAPERAEEWLRVAESDGLARPVALQPEYNLVARQRYETAIAPLARAHDLAVFPYYGVAGGFLTGKYRKPADVEGAFRRKSVSRYLNPEGLRVLEALDEVAVARGAALATVALAWLLARPTVTAPLASATNLDQLGELMAAPGLALTAGEVERLDAASAAFA